MTQTRCWWTLAACRELASADYDPFFADTPAADAEAAVICASCRVVGECLAYAVRTAQPYGVWGGRPRAVVQRLIAADLKGHARRAAALEHHHNAGKARCKHGHPFTPENTYYRPNGERRCRTCLHAAWHRWKAERRQQQPPPVHEGGGLDA